MSWIDPLEITVGKILLGIVIGVAISGLAFSLFDPTTEESVPADQSAVEVDARLRSSEQSVASRSIDENSESRVATAASASTIITQNDNARADSLALPKDEAALPEDEAAREARLRREVEQAQATVRRASAELERLAIARMLAANPVVSPSPLPPEFDWVADETYRGVFHERFQREPIDGEEPQSFVASATE